MAPPEREVIYTVQVDQVRPGDFVARALAFPNVLALGDTEAEAVSRAASPLHYQIRDARAREEPAPTDVSSGYAGARQVKVSVDV
jgi:hypothetical protein